MEEASAYKSTQEADERPEYTAWVEARADARRQERAALEDRIIELADVHRLLAELEEE